MQPGGGGGHRGRDGGEGTRGFCWPPLSGRQVHQLITQHHKLIDIYCCETGHHCRTEEEWSKGHPDKSINVPYMFITPQGNKLLFLRSVHGDRAIPVSHIG